MDYGITTVFLIAGLLGRPDGAARQATSAGQQKPQAPTTGTPQLPVTANTTNELVAGEAESVAPKRALVHWNEYQGPYFSLRVGGGFLWDWASFIQDENSQQQVSITSPDNKLRDFRVLLSGRLAFRRKTTWSAGIMYDAANKEWVMRQTGIMVAIPEIWGDIFIGRTKEGISLNKVMIGYGGWTNERSPTNDAIIPILADGVKWLGYVAKARLIWNVGVYDDLLSEGQSFSKYSNQVVWRVAWLPMLSTDGGRLLHVGVSGRYAKVNDGKLRLTARPGAWTAPFFIDTGTFAADTSTTTGFEIYYRPGSVTMGSEYYWVQVDAPASDNPSFHGGEVFATWLITGEVRSYNTRGGYFNQISPMRPVRKGGPGAWEVVGHYSYADFNGGTITGGKYWRITPMLNWYFSDNTRLELTYGYGSLNKFGLTGKTHFFQLRIQLQL